ncbi:hypothetical protein GT347_00670 [Xylophilus rhododendri]|uniref:Uncharacterized protein n=1 Tax=Xylophilus rhododendri TaxID=2697032 RepID=A0A857J0Z7_9BURK|nr:hypothetical protein [Xylophilus rhododendri]QHI96638.1 hypothetical protein GT347_00670 [Xylophilus rhododendri]
MNLPSTSATAPRLHHPYEFDPLAPAGTASQAAGTVATQPPLIDVPTASGEACFADKRQQFARLVDDIDTLTQQDAPVLRRRMLDFLRFGGHDIAPVMLQPTQMHLDAACRGYALPDPLLVESVGMRALVCWLPASTGWEAGKRGYFKQALMAAFDALEAAQAVRRQPPGLDIADRKAVEGHLAELVADPCADKRGHKRAALLSILGRYGYEGGVRPNAWTWKRLQDGGPDAQDEALGMPQLLAAIESMPAHPELHASLQQALLQAVVEQGRQWKAAQALGVQAQPEPEPEPDAARVDRPVNESAAPDAARTPLARFEASWRWIEAEVPPSTGIPSRHVFRPAGSKASAGDVLLYRGGSGTRMVVQSVRQSRFLSQDINTQGLALLRNADGTAAVTLDRQPVTDPRTLDLLLRAVETFRGDPASGPALLLQESLELLLGAAEPDIAQKARAAQFALAGLMSIDLPAGEPMLADGALAWRDPEALLVVLTLAGSSADLRCWVAAFQVGLRNPQDVLAQARVDIAIRLALAGQPDPAQLRFYRRAGVDERHAIVAELLAFTREKSLFCLGTLLWRTAPQDARDGRDDSVGTLEYASPDGFARVTDMLCELRQAFEEDPQFIAICEAFVAEFAMGCTDRAAIGLAGLGLLLNWHKVRDDQTRALQALRSLLNFHRMAEAAVSMLTASGSSSEPAQAALRLMIAARSRYLLLPDHGPRYLRHLDEEGTHAATMQRMDAALRFIMEASPGPVLSTPLIQASPYGADYIQRNLGHVEPAQLEQRGDEIERLLTPYAYLRLLPGLACTPLTVPVLKRLLLEVVAPDVEPPTPMQELLRRMGAALTQQDGWPAEAQAEQMRRGLIGELIDAIARQEPAFAALVARRLTVGDSLQAQCAALAEELSG